jgi:hypothetical protein
MHTEIVITVSIKPWRSNFTQWTNFSTVREPEFSRRHALAIWLKELTQKWLTTVGLGATNPRMSAPVIIYRILELAKLEHFQRLRTLFAPQLVNSLAD